MWLWGGRGETLRTLEQSWIARCLFCPVKNVKIRKVDRLKWGIRVATINLICCFSITFGQDCKHCMLPKFGNVPNWQRPPISSHSSWTTMPIIHPSCRMTVLAGNRVRKVVVNCRFEALACCFPPPLSFLAQPDGLRRDHKMRKETQKMEQICIKHPSVLSKFALWCTSICCAFYLLLLQIKACYLCVGRDTKNTDWNGGLFHCKKEVCNHTNSLLMDNRVPLILSSHLELLSLPREKTFISGKDCWQPF